MIKIIKNYINSFLFKFGYRLSKINNSHELFKVHSYKNYNEYRNTQIFYNQKKIDQIWADGKNLKKISFFLSNNIKKKKIKGLCHGSRNGFEQEFLFKVIKKTFIIGTDISSSATNFKNTVQWDFHKRKKSWINLFDFIYSNSLDHSYNPRKALTIWLEQIKKNSYIILEHAEQSSLTGQGKMDPFGVDANFLPYLLSDWFGHQILIKIIKSIKENKMNSPIWLFILKKIK